MVEAPSSIVMIIGADSDFTYLMQYYAKKSGQRAVISSPDEDALDLAKREKPAVIVLEGDLAETVGWDTLQTLKADRDTCHIPVVVCSWLDEAASELAEGAACYLQKPVLYGDFVTALVDIEQARGEKGGDERLETIG